MTPQEILSLKSEIESDPLGRGYASMSDSEVAASLNLPNIVGQATRVALTDIVTYLRLQQAWLGIKASQSVAAQSAVDLYNDQRITDLDVTSELVKTLLEQLVSESLVTEDQKNTIIAMGTPMISRAKFIGLSVALTDVDIQAARAG